MALTQQTYLQSIKKGLEVSLCLRDYPSEFIERQNQPEIEMFQYSQKNQALILNPLYIARSEKEKCLIESSINSCRINLCIKQSDNLEKLITQKFFKFFAQRADQAKIIRKKPIQDYDISFLIMNSHLEIYDKNMIIDFILSLVENVEKDINELKLNIITQTRIAATYFVNCLTNDKSENDKF